MKSTDKTIENITRIAVTKVAATKIPFVVYKFGKGYDFCMAHLRPTNYEKILSYEKESVIIKDSKGKTLEKVSTKKVVPEKKESKKSKTIKSEPQNDTDNFEL
jgi:hypothetical protein